MSRQRNIQIACPRCKRRINVTVWDIVDTNMAPDLPNVVISGDLFRHKCPECDTQISLEMPLLYNDVNNRARIWVLDRRQDVNAELAKLDPAILGSPVPADRTRRVSSNRELAEKVCMLEAARDDRVVEVVKYLELQNFRMKYPTERVAGVRYAYRNGSELLVYFNDEGGEHETAFNPAVYDEWAGYLQAIVRTMSMEDYSVVDQKFAEDMLFGYFGQMMALAQSKRISVLQLQKESAKEAAGTQEQAGKGEKKKKKGCKGILAVIIALVVVLLASGAFVYLKYNTNLLGQCWGEVNVGVNSNNPPTVGEGGVINFIEPNN